MKNFWKKKMIIIALIGSLATPVSAKTNMPKVNWLENSFNNKSKTGYYALIEDKDIELDLTPKQVGYAKLEYKPYTQSNLTVEQFDKILKGTYMEGLGYVFKEIEYYYNVNGLFTLGVLHSEQGLRPEARPKVKDSCNPFSILEKGVGTPLRNFCLEEKALLDTNQNLTEEQIQKLGYANSTREFAKRITRGHYERVGLVQQQGNVNVTDMGKVYCGGGDNNLWNGKACYNVESGRWDEMVKKSMDRFFNKAIK